MAAPHPALLPLIRGEALPPDTLITSELVSSAEEHRVAALVDTEIQRRGIELDPDLATRLAMSSLTAEGENHTALEAVAAVTEAATNIGVEFAVFKGATTGVRWYENPQARPTVDVDIFVSPFQLDRLGDLAIALGDESEDAPILDAMAASGRVFEHSIEVAGIHVDLHRDPMNLVLPTRQEQAMWDDTVTVSLPNGLDVRTLSLEWAIIQALLHSFRDNFADLLHIYDLDLMLNDDPDWGQIAEIARAEGWGDIIRYATAFVCDTLGRPSPLPRQIARWRLKLIESIWSRDLLLQGADSVVTSMRRQSALDVLAKGRNRELAGAYAKRLAPPREVIDLRAGPTDDLYPVALYRWRLSQARSNADMRTDGDITQDPEDNETV
jgi:hypothetical protein